MGCAGSTGVRTPRPNGRALRICYFRALQLGEALRVAPIDKLSVVFAIAFRGDHPAGTAHEEEESGSELTIDTRGANITGCMPLHIRPGGSWITLRRALSAARGSAGSAHHFISLRSSTVDQCQR